MELKMVRRDAAGHQIETRIFERHRFGFGVGGSHVRQGALLRLGLHHIEHFLGDVGGPHTRDMRRESVGDMATTSRDVEDMPALLWGGEGDQTLETFPDRVRLAGQIACGSLAEFFLDKALVHDFPRRVRRAAYIACLARARYAATHEIQNDGSAPLVVAAAQVVITVAIAVKNQRHQAPSYQEGK